MRNLKEAFGFKLKNLRKNKKYTQEALAEMLDLSPRQIIRIENGENFPSVETLGKISLLLNVPLQNLFDFTWNENVMYFDKGTYNKPSLRLIKKNHKIIIKQLNPSQFEKLKIPEHSKFSEYESEIINLCKKTDGPITVEMFNKNKRVGISKFYPDGKIEKLLTEDDILCNDLYNSVLKSIEKMSSNIKKLNYIKTAIESLEDNNSLERLKILIQGMDLRK